jgi:hypothetical protein
MNMEHMLMHDTRDSPPLKARKRVALLLLAAGIVAGLLYLVTGDHRFEALSAILPTFGAFLLTL